MVFSDEDKSFNKKKLIGIQRQSAHKLLDEFPNKNWNRGNVDYLLKKFAKLALLFSGRQAAFIVHRREY
jgi:hypothetical protein